MATRTRNKKANRAKKTTCGQAAIVTSSPSAGTIPKGDWIFSYIKDSEFDFEAWYASDDYEALCEESSREYARVNSPFWYWLGEKIKAWKNKR